MAKKIFSTYVTGSEMHVSVADSYCYDAYTVTLEGNYLSATNTCNRKKISVPIIKSSFLRRSITNAFASLIIELGISEGGIPGYYIQEFVDNNLGEIEQLSKINNIPVEQSPEDARNEAVGTAIGLGVGLGVVGIAALIDHFSSKKR